MRDFGPCTARATGLCPWNSWLKFRNGGLESAFLNSIESTWMAFDSHVLGLVLFGTVSRLVAPSVASAKLSSAWIIYSFSLLFDGVAFHLYCKWKYHNDRASYLRDRFTILLLNRVVSIGMGCVMVQFSEQRWSSHEVCDVLLLMLSHTPIPANFMSALALRLPFYRHAVVHIVTVLINMIWVQDMCWACERNPRIAQAVNILGYRTEGVLMRLGALGFPVHRPALEPGQYPCWLVGLFYHFWVGFLIPSAILYASECRSRSEFLESISEEREHESIRSFRTGNMVLTILFFVVGTLTVWFGAKEVISIFAHLCEFNKNEL